MKILFHTLGCKVNQFETQAMAALLVEKGHEIAQSGPADVYVINTCAVTGESARKSRQAVRRFRKNNPSAKIVVCGCYSQSDYNEALSLGADYVGGSGGRMKVVEYINGLTARNPADCPDDWNSGFDLTGYERLPAGALGEHARALLKVQDGCDNFCSYCIIPHLRGRVRSLPVDEAVSEAIRLREAGFLEIILTGIEISSYGKDIGTDLARLVTSLCEALSGGGQVPRLRLGSLEPRTITREFAQALSACDNLCPHFHLSLQSGSEKVLGLMNRKYSPARFSESTEILREYFPGCAITTDVIVGFPGETESDFADSLDFVVGQRFSRVHVFPYSVRKGTRAALMDGQVEKKEKERRAAQMSAAVEKSRLEYLDGQKGRSLSVLFESERDGYWTGHSENYAEVMVAGSELRGRLLPVKITGQRDGILTGEISCENALWESAKRR